LNEVYRPAWAPHVSGEIPPRVPNGDGGYEPQWLALHCSICHDRSRFPCTSGAPRQSILKYATNHVHRDPLEVKKK